MGLESKTSRGTVPPSTLAIIVAGIVSIVIGSMIILPRLNSTSNQTNSSIPQKQYVIVGTPTWSFSYFYGSCSANAQLALKNIGTQTESYSVNFVFKDSNQNPVATTTVPQQVLAGETKIISGQASFSCQSGAQYYMSYSVI